MKTHLKAIENLERSALEIEREYTHKNIPLGGYLTLIGVYAATFATLSVLTNRRNRSFQRPKGADLAALTIASYKISRVVTMSFIGSPLRAPFTHRGHSLKGGEVQDESRGEGLQKAIGNLLTCPFCFSVWSSTFLIFGYQNFPRTTLQASYILSVAAIDDLLNSGYKELRDAFSARATAALA